MDPISATALTFGLFLLLASWVQLIIDSFKKDYSWGLSTVFLPPLSYLYACFSFKENQSTLWLAVGGWVLVIFSIL